jgi:hypothetical protein
MNNGELGPYNSSLEDIMRRWVKRILYAAGIALIILLVGSGWYLSDTLPISSGHTANAPLLRLLSDNILVFTR